MPLFRPQRQVFPVSSGATAGFAPADATTYTFGLQPGINPGTADSIWAVSVPRPGRVTRAAGVFIVAGTLGSAGSITVRVRNSIAGTTQDVTTSLSATSVLNSFSNNALSLAFAAGDALLIQFVCPTWATNPTLTFWTGSIEVEFSS